MALYWLAAGPAILFGLVCAGVGLLSPLKDVDFYEGPLFAAAMCIAAPIVLWGFWRLTLWIIWGQWKLPPPEPKPNLPHTPIPPPHPTGI